MTPPIGSHLAGYAARLERSTGVYHPLSCTVTAITDQRCATTLILVSIEWLGFYDRTERVRRLICEATGVPTGNILLCGTHTHCGPPMRKGTDEFRHGGVDDPFLERTFARIADAARDAVASPIPVRLRSTTGWCGLAHSRRRPDGKGGVTWQPTLDAPHDHSVPILLFEDESGQLRHLLFGYACHPTAGGPILKIGGDYAGFALEEVQRSLGCTASFLLGCAGDQKPFLPDTDMAGFPPYPIEAIAAMGRRLAASVDNAVRHHPGIPVDGPLQIRSGRLELVNEVQPRDVYEAAYRSTEEHLRRWGDHHLAILDAGRSPDTGLEFEIQTVLFGADLALVALSGEMSAEYGLELNRRFGARFGRVWPVGYANAMVGYVPSARQYSECGYEVIDNMQYLLRPAPLARDSEGRIVEAIDKLLR
ncbi:MAG: hypothetical protein R3F07_17175 [Opitutaceae bacterium]